MRRREKQSVSPRSRAVNWIRDAIRDGSLAPGDAVPTVNELSAAAGVARNTAAAALVEAERLRLIERRVAPRPHGRKTSARAPGPHT